MEMHIEGCKTKSKKDAGWCEIRQIGAKLFTMVWNAAENEAKHQIMNYSLKFESKFIIHDVLFARSKQMSAQF